LRGEVELLADGSIDENVFGDIKNDAIRRDFTCNALYLDPTNLQIHDYVGGVEDIKKKRLRMIGDPGSRMVEDSIRLLRAIRFKHKLGFHYDKDLQEAIKQHIYILQDTVRERIRLELNKMFQTGVAQGCMAELSKLGAWDKIYWPMEELHLKYPKSYNMFLDMCGLVKDDLVEPNNTLYMAILAWLPLQRELDNNDHNIGEIGHYNWHDITNSKVMRSMRHDLKATNNEIIQFQQILELRPVLYLQERISPRQKAHYFKNPMFQTAIDFCKIESLAGELPMDWYPYWEEEYYHYMQRHLELKTIQKHQGRGAGRPHHAGVSDTPASTTQPRSPRQGGVVAGDKKVRLSDDNDLPLAEASSNNHIPTEGEVEGPRTPRKRRRRYRGPRNKISKPPVE